MTQSTNGFVRGNDRLKAILDADPDLAARVESGVEEMHEADRIYAMNLAAVRKAADLTQNEMAQRLGITQGQISRVENGHAGMLSSFLAYLNAAGVKNVALTGEVAGKPVKIALAAAVA